jgi:hypothetical protein
VLAKVTRMGKGEEVSFVSNLYVATPAVLAHYGLHAADLDPTSDVISSRRSLAGLQIFESRLFCIRQFQLGTIEQMKHHHLMLSISKMLKRPHERLLFDPQITQENHHTSPRQALGQRVKMIDQLCRLARLDRFHRFEKPIEMRRR